MLHYKKNDNKTLFKSFENEDLTHLTKIQNYIPIYKKFFNLNSNNYNSINLNNENSMVEIKSKENHVVFDCILEKGGKKPQKVFFKFSPLLDPVKYLSGKYKDVDISKLPQFENNTCNEKLLDPNNCAYIDGFFSYLTSCLYNKYKFVNAIDFYGSFLGIKSEFNYNIYEDLEYLYESEFFNENNNGLFKIENLDEDFFDNVCSLKNKKKIKIDSSQVELTVDTLDDKMFEGIFKENDSKERKIDLSNNVVFSDLKKKNFTNQTSSTCSSRYSDTSNEDEDDEDDEIGDDEDYESLDDDEEGDDDGEEDDDDMSSFTSEESVDDNLDCTIFDFPVQVICLEKLENTLDSLMEDENYEISNSEWKAILMQIIMMLITYQKCFSFTHNDLHTNNVMYNKTDKKFLYYRYNGKIYKVPTYGKIFKLIDFGRSIYKFKGKQICSDSFHPKGDAATQYNFGPYYNEKKPKIEPNYSFDLCRLACSLYDYFIEEDDDVDDLDSIGKLVYSWVIDDKGKNVLYKKNGDERYPDFKLYKMITRLVHNHLPRDQLKNPMFQKYIISKRKMNKKTKLIDIDSFEEFSV